MDKQKDKVEIKWDEKAIKNFEGFLTQMYGEHGKIITNK